MTFRPRQDYSWEGAAEAWRRFAAANDRATAVWLSSLSEEESVRIFEELCEGIADAPLPEAIPDPAPVVLFRIWKYGPS